VVGSILLALRARFTGQRQLYVIAACLPPLTIVNAVGNAAVIKLATHTIDRFLLATDFGVSRAVYAWFQLHPSAFAVIHVTYFWLPIWGAVVLCFAERTTEAAISMGIAPLGALPFFLLFPACGPIWINVRSAPRNCIPSMHMVWVLLLWYYSPRWLRPLAVFVVMLTAAATLGLGEHYVIDLIVAVPYSLLIVCLVEHRGKLLLNRGVKLPSERPLALPFRPKDQPN